MPRINRRRRYRNKRAAERSARRRECFRRILFSVIINADEAIKKMKRLTEATEFLKAFTAKLKE